jgi:pimeloyl-ACP methyl ester carboxylesterase
MVYDHLRQVAGDKPILVTGNSIGTTCALYLAARRPMAGLLLRNPPPLKQLIIGEYGWWNLSLGARVVAAGVPRELDSIANAARAKVPAVILTSGKDHVVPPAYQQRIIDAYAGAKRIVRDAEADHSTPLSPEIERDYLAALEWLEREALGRHVKAEPHLAMGG